MLLTMVQFRVYLLHKEGDAMRKGHWHYWHYPHNIIQGRTGNEVAVVRYCTCGVRQVAFASKWTQAKGDYALDEHYDLVTP